MGLRQIVRPRRLTELANQYRSDKGTQHFERHGYTEIYERLFAPRRRERLTLLEIGLRHDPYYSQDDLPSSSPSLQMWLDYFPRATVCGLDINDFSHMAGGRTRIFQGDQSDEATIRGVLEAVPAFDIIIDDGSHASYHQWASLRMLIDAVKPGGLYIVEDLYWQPEDLERELPAVALTKDRLRDPGGLAELDLEPADVEFYVGGKLAVIRPRR